MNHLSDDQLLLHACGESPAAERGAMDEHLAACPDCRARFIALEEGRAALDWGMTQPASRRRRAWWLALPVAAGLGAVLLLRGADENPAEPRVAWQSHLVASPTAGYVAGGAALIAIDSQLTQLERGRTYGTPGN